MSDQFQSSNSVSAPSRNVFVITPHASNEVSPLPKAVRFDGAGAVTFRAVDSPADVVMNVVAGEVLDIRIQYLRATGTTVSAAIHGLA